MPSWMKTGPYAPTPLGKKPNAPVKTENQFEKLEDKETDKSTDLNESGLDVDDEEKRGIKRKHPIEASNDATTSKQEPIPDAKRKASEESSANKETEKEELVEEEDEEANDPVRLWEDGWKERYYKVKFDVSEQDHEFRRKVARHYAIGLQWVLKYYYQGVPSWGWYFPYHYAPFASDFVDIADAITDFDKPSQPFNPFEQLMAVFPAGSKQHVPQQWQFLMNDPHSPIIDFYPEDFQVDLNGKKQSWQGVALLPFVDEKRLMKAIEPLIEKLDPEQRKRNTRGNDRIFVRKSHSLYESLKVLYIEENGKKYRLLKNAIDIETSISGGIAGKVWCDEHVVLENETVKSPLRFLCPDLKFNQAISVLYHDPLYDSSHIFNTLILEGAM
jgi:5'-3' exoribonuclease 2